MKKIGLFLIAMLMVATVGVTASAEESNIQFVGEKPVSDSELVTIREDVPTAQAANDSGFSLAEAQKNNLRARKGGAKWVCKGSKIWGTVNGVYGAKPHGYTYQKNQDTDKIEPTYHYTHVYFNYLGSKCGSSGRVWGNGTVYATGTQCLRDVVDNSVTTVKYGINND